MNYSDIEAKVREATNDDTWGPHGSLMGELAKYTFTYEHYPSQVTKWPFTCIRKYGTHLNGNVFALEAGRRAPSGEGLFAFKTEEAADIKERIDYYINSQRR